MSENNHTATILEEWGLVEYFGGFNNNMKEFLEGIPGDCGVRMDSGQIITVSQFIEGREFLPD